MSIANGFRSIYSMCGPQNPKWGYNTFISLSLSSTIVVPYRHLPFPECRRKKEGLQNLTVKCFWFTASIVVNDVTISAPKCGQFRKAANLPIYNRCYLSRMGPPFWHVTRWNYQINERLTHPTGFSRSVRIFRVSADAIFASIPHKEIARDD